MIDETTPQAIYNELQCQLGPIFEAMEWAEDEITQAQQRHPAKADLQWTTFKLLVPTHDLMRTEFVYRSHVRELLERVACGEDTLCRSTIAVVDRDVAADDRAHSMEADSVCPSWPARRGQGQASTTAS